MTFKRTSSFSRKKLETSSPSAQEGEALSSSSLTHDSLKDGPLSNPSNHLAPKASSSSSVPMPHSSVLDPQAIKQLPPAQAHHPKASRFFRMSVADHASSVPSSDYASQEVNWKVWGVDVSQASPLDHFDQANCPKCKHNALLVDTTQDSDNHGLFLCLFCQFTGHARQTPKTFRGSFVSAWQQYLFSSTHSVKDWVQEHLSKEKQESVQGLDLYVGFAFTPTHQAHVEDTLSLCLHAPCLDDKEKLRDAYIYHPLHQWFRYDLPAYPLNWHHTEKHGKAILTQDVFDLGSLLHANISNVSCLPPDLDTTLTQSNAWKVLEFMEEGLSDASEIVFLFPQGQNLLEEELARRMGKERCFRVRWDTPSLEYTTQESLESLENVESLPSDQVTEDNPYTLDALPEDLTPEEMVAPPSTEMKEVTSVQQALDVYGLSFVETMIEVATPFPVSGIHELADLDDRFEELYTTGLTPGAETGWPSMDIHYTVKTGQWTLVTGIPGHGKSSWLDALLVNLATLHGWRFGLFSPENQPMERHFASLMEKKIRKPFSKGPTPRISNEEKNQCKRWLNDKFKIILPDEDDGLWTLDAVLNLAKTLVYRYGIRGLVIDPWNELDHARSSHISETTYISECLTKVRRFARLYDIHVWIIAHPTKLEKKSDGKYPVATPYDVSGGAHWRNKADNAISVYRNVDEPDFDVSDIYVQKIRFKEVGSLGVTSLRSDVASGAYIDDIDQSKREYSLRSGTYAPSSSLRLPSPRQYSKQKIAVTHEF